MKKAVWGTIALGATLFLFATDTFAQGTDSATIVVTANVAARAKLTLGATNVAFPDADPDTTPTLASGVIDVAVKARTTLAGSVGLAMVASDDLKSGLDVIGIGNLSWTVTGAGYAAGTANKTTAQNMGSWTGSGNYVGTHMLNLVNRWSYAPGNYSVTLTYTLTAP